MSAPATPPVSPKSSTEEPGLAPLSAHPVQGEPDTKAAQAAIEGTALTSTEDKSLTLRSITDISAWYGDTLGKKIVLGFLSIITIVPACLVAYRAYILRKAKNELGKDFDNQHVTQQMSHLQNDYIKTLSSSCLTRTFSERPIKALTKLRIREGEYDKAIEYLDRDTIQKINKVLVNTLKYDVLIKKYENGLCSAEEIVLLTKRTNHPVSIEDLLGAVTWKENSSPEIIARNKILIDAAATRRGPYIISGRDSAALAYHCNQLSSHLLTKEQSKEDSSEYRDLGDSTEYSDLGVNDSTHYKKLAEEIAKELRANAPSDNQAEIEYRSGLTFFCLLGQGDEENQKSNYDAALLSIISAAKGGNEGAQIWLGDHYFDRFIGNFKDSANMTKRDLLEASKEHYTDAMRHGPKGAIKLARFYEKLLEFPPGVPNGITEYQKSSMMRAAETIYSGIYHKGLDDKRFLQEHALEWNLAKEGALRVGVPSLPRSQHIGPEVPGNPSTY